MSNTIEKNAHISSYLRKIKLPEPSSHKGQNGKLLIVGGSELFHAASKWSLDVASKFVDMVFYSSVPSNNALIQEAKGQFWNGIIVERDHLFDYVEEAGVVLIGPGMTRSDETKQMVDTLLKNYPHKRLVIDAGALQMMNPRLCTSNCILTPHERELHMVLEHAGLTDDEAKTVSSNTSNMLSGATLVVKGPVDIVADPNHVIPIEGGNAGMTKGGTGDTLAGLIAALYCTSDALTAAVVGSYINKKAGEYLFKTVGPFFNASDLVTAVPLVMWQALTEA